MDPFGISLIVLVGIFFATIGLRARQIYASDTEIKKSEPLIPEPIKAEPVKPEHVKPEPVEPEVEEIKETK